MFSRFGTDLSEAFGIAEIDVRAALGKAWEHTMDEQVPRFKLKGVLERSAAADLWKHTLSRIPTLYGRLAYLASLRDAHSGAYKHHGLSTAFGREESARALKKSHEDTFLEWLEMDLEQKVGDLREYLKSLEDDSAEVIRYLEITGTKEAPLPDCALPMERQLFHRDIETVIALLKGPGAGAPDPASGPRE